MIAVVLLVAGILIPALFLGRVLLGRQPGLRHGFLTAAVLLAAAAPLWLALAERRPPPGRSIVVTGSDDPAPVMAARRAVAATVAAIPQPPRTGWPVLLALWAAGAAVGLGRIGLGLRRVAAIARRARPLAPGVFISDEIPAAMVVGIFRPAVLVSPQLAAGPRDVLAEVLAHERAHARRRDPVWGLLQRLAAAAYWFHPAVHLAARALDRAREEACDDAVIERHAPTHYSRTLLALASGNPQRLPAPAVQPAAADLERRIRRVLDSRPRPRRLLGAALAAALVVAAGAPLALALAPASGAPVSAGPTEERAASEAERAVFALAGPRVSAAFVLRDLGTGKTVVLNPALARQRLTPASTFKVIVALVGLETGVVSDETFALHWKGQPSDVAAWNQDHTLLTAMRTSANWYFEEVLRRIDPAHLDRALRDLHYGNESRGADAVHCYTNGDLTISAVEQVDVVERLGGSYRMRPATRKVMAKVTEIERTEHATIHGKTGTAVGPDVGAISWLVGHVRRDGRDYAFATVLRAPQQDATLLRDQRLPITRALLARFGAL